MENNSNTFESVWAALNESSAEFDRRTVEFNRRAEEADRRAAAALSHAETKKQFME